MFLGLQEPGTPGRRLRLALRLQQEYEPDKEALVAAGRPRALVEKMPHVQVALLHSFAEYERMCEEVLKWQTFSYAEAAPHLRAALERQKAERIATDPGLSRRCPRA